MYENPEQNLIVRLIKGGINRDRQDIKDKSIAA
jgi:hypothetical protein